MKKFFYSLLIYFVLFALASVFSQAQGRFSISEVNTSEFPYVKATFIATDTDDEPFEDLATEDFEVTEQGIKIPPEDLRIDCVDSLQYPALSILMILDQSESMNEKDTATNQKRWQWVTEGVKSFIRSIRYEKNDSTMIAMTSFHGGALVRCPWTRDTTEFKDSLRKIKPAGRTLYEPPFLDHVAGATAMLRQRPSDIRRVAIFLTDGEPDTYPKIDSIVSELQNYNIQCYCITVAMPMTDELNIISKETGGNAYAADTKQKLNDIYRIIAADIQRTQLCDLIWKTDYACDDFDPKRKVKILFKRLSVSRNLTYTVPENGIARVDTDSDILYFGNPEPGAANSVNKELVLTPENSSFTITGAEVIPPGYFELDYPGGEIPIAEGEDYKVDIKFTQENDKLYRQATLKFKGDPCPPQITLVGGLSKIHLIKPNGGEVYSTCDTVNIKWGGVEDITPVILSYRVDEGSSWQTITNNATGLIYKWVPPVPSDEYRVRASVSEEFSYMWLRGFGGAENDVATSIAVQDDDLYFYTTGHFEDKTGLGPDTLRAKDGKDIFVAKHNIDGSVVWAQSAGGPGIDTSAGVCVDPDNNAYITGVIYSGAKFGSMIQSLPLDGVPYFFVARFPSTGAAPVVKWIGADDLYTKFRAWGTKIRYKDGEVYVQGLYTGSIQYKGFGLPDRDEPQKFTAIYDTDNDFKLKNLYLGGEDYEDYSNAEDMDSDGNVYECGSFVNELERGTHKIQSSGRKDIFISKYGGTPGSEDISDEVFKVGSPKLEFVENSRDLGDCIISQTEYHNLTAFLQNTGSMSVEIARAEFIGANPNDFSLDINLIGKTIQPGSAIDIPVNFKAQDVGIRNAQLEIEGVCADPVTLSLSGNGICSGKVVGAIDFGNVNVNISDQKTFDCIFENTNYSILRVDPVVLGDNAGEFDWNPKGAVNLQPGECHKLTITFTPTAFGERTAYIDYQLDEACEQKITTLRGYGENADISVNSIDWGRHRVRTVNDSFLVVTNNTSQPVTVEQISLEQPENDIKLYPDFPREVPSYDTIRVPVSFRPVLEQTNTNTVIFEIDALSDKLRAPLRGEGFLPKIKAYFICDDATKVGETSMATLRVENPSESAELTIDEIRFQNPTQEFDWATGQNPVDITIDRQSEEDYNIVFSPQQAGARNTNIVITHDALPGPERNPRKDTVVPAFCEALGIEFDSDVDFGNLMLCDNDTREIELENNAFDSDLIIDSWELIGPDMTAFEINGLPDNFTVDGGQSKSFEVTFKPTEPRLYSATLVLNNNLGFDISFDLEGYGEYIRLSTSNSKIDAEPGQRNDLRVLGKIADIANDPIKDITIRIKFNPTMVMFDPVTLETQLTDWTWNTPQFIDDGILEVVGMGNLGTPFDGELFNLDFFIYLGDTQESSIEFSHLLNPCTTPDVLATDIKIDEVCFLDGRLITVSGSKYALYDPSPNPAGETLNVKFGVGFETITTVELYNSMGSRVRTIVNKRLRAGLYEHNISTGELSSGVYLLKMNAGPYTETRQVVISK